MVKRSTSSSDKPDLGLSREETERLCMRNLLDLPSERIFFKDLDSRFHPERREFFLNELLECSLEHILR